MIFNRPDTSWRVNSIRGSFLLLGSIWGVHLGTDTLSRIRADSSDSASRTSTRHVNRRNEYTRQWPVMLHGWGVCRYARVWWQVKLLIRHVVIPERFTVKIKHHKNPRLQRIFANIDFPRTFRLGDFAESCNAIFVICSCCQFSICLSVTQMHLGGIKGFNSQGRWWNMQIMLWFELIV